MAGIYFDARIDSEHLKKDIEEIKRSLGTMTSEVQKSGRSVDSMISGWGARMAAAFSVGAVIQFFRTSIAGWIEQERGIIKVEQAVRQTGQAAGYTSDQLVKMASEMQKVTTFGDDVILNEVTAKLLTFTNITGENFEKAQKAALDMATVLGGDLSGAVLQLGKALNDPATSLSALTRSGTQFTAQQKETIDALIAENRLFDAQSLILEEINHQYGGQADAIAKTNVGKIQQVKNAWGDVKEEFGKLIIESDRLTKVLGRLQATMIVVGSEQLSFWEKRNPFTSLADKLKLATERQSEFDEENEKSAQRFEDIKKILSGGIWDNISPETNTEAIARLNEELSTANAELTKLKSSGAKFDYTAVIEKEKEIKEIQDQLRVAQGLGKDFEKTAKGYADRLKEILDAEEDYSQKRIELALETEAAKVSAMEDGIKKQLAEADLAYKRELVQIEAQRQSLLEAYNREQELKGQATVQVLPTEIQSQINDQSLSAAVKHEAEIVKIKKDSAQKIIDIQSEVTKAFMSDQDKEIAAVNEKYQRMIDDAVKAGNLILTTDLQTARQNEVDAINQQAALRRIDYEEEAAARIVDIENSGIDNTAIVEAKRIAIYKKYALERVKVLQASQKVEDKQAAELIKLQIQQWDKDLENLAKISARDVVSAFGDIANSVGQVDKELGDLLNGMADLADSAITAFEGFKNKDFLSAVTGSIGFVTGIIDMLSKDSSEDKLVKSLDRINSQLQTQSELLRMLDEGSANYFDVTSQMADNYNEVISKNTVQLRKLLQLSEQGEQAFADIMVDFMDSGWWDKLYANTTRNFVDTKKWSIDEIIDAYSKGLLDLNEKDEEILRGVIQAQNGLLDLQGQIRSEITGTTRDSIADSIIEGFQSGKASITDFADTFSDVMKEAMMTVWKQQFMNSNTLKTFYNKLYAFGEEGGGYSEEDIDSLRITWNQLITSSQSAFEAIKAIAGDTIDFAEDGIKQQGLTGAIKGITEETAGLIAGQFTAMRENLLELKMATSSVREKLGLDANSISDMLISIRDFSGSSINEIAGMKEIMSQIQNTSLNQMTAINESVGHLANIEKNTRDISVLNTIHTDIQEMNKYLKETL